jgi:undecaprenyl-phosphate galactose phosphotransferase
MPTNFPLSSAVTGNKINTLESAPALNHHENSEFTFFRAAERQWKRSQLVKRAFDLVISSLILLCISPILLIVYVLIRLDSKGPVFYCQKRVGQDGKIFGTWKFRTMVVDAEQRLREYLEAHPEAKQEWETNFKLKKDPRITGVGRFLRKTSLDELPQLFNVVTGEMSLVGPRPLPEYHHFALASQTRAMREMVRPGITGQWQISSRSDGDLSDLERHDTYYVSNWSMRLDLEILFKTPLVVITGKGAY